MGMSLLLRLRLNRIIDTIRGRDALRAPTSSIPDEQVVSAHLRFTKEMMMVSPESPPVETWWAIARCSDALDDLVSALARPGVQVDFAEMGLLYAGMQRHQLRQMAARVSGGSA